MKTAKMLLVAAFAMMFGASILAGCHPGCKEANCTKKTPCRECACYVKTCNQVPVTKCETECQELCVNETTCHPVCTKVKVPKTITVEVEEDVITEKCETHPVCKKVCVNNSHIETKTVEGCAKGTPVAGTEVVCATNNEENKTANVKEHKAKKEHKTTKKTYTPKAKKMVEKPMAPAAPVAKPMPMAD